MLLYLSIFTIAISLVLLYYNWSTNKNVLYLTAVFIFTSLFGIGHYFMALDDSRFWLAVFYNHFSPFMFLMGPFLYFYVRNTLKGRNTLSKKDWFHFVPATIALIGTIPYAFQPFEKKLVIADQIIRDLDAFKEIEVNLFYDMGQSFALRCILAFVYLIYCLYLVLKTHSAAINEKSIPKKQFIIIYRWLLVLLTCLLFLFVSFILLTVQAAHSTPSKTLEDGYALYVISGIAYSVMSFSLLFFPHILYGMPKRSIPKTQKIKKNIIKGNSREDSLLEVSNTIETYLVEKKPFLNPDFDVSTIAIDLNIPQNQVSDCISIVMKTKFSKLKSKLRILHAVELLKKDSVSKLTIEAIGSKCGFNTRSNFYASFKAETGVTPTEYIEHLNKNKK